MALAHLRAFVLEAELARQRVSLRRQGTPSSRDRVLVLRSLVQRALQGGFFRSLRLAADSRLRPVFFLEEAVVGEGELGNFLEEPHG